MGVAINPLNLRGYRVTADMYSQRMAKVLESIKTVDPSVLASVTI